MLCGWEGNHRSGIALAMRHRLSGLSTYGLNGQCERDEHPAYTPLEHGSLYPITFMLAFLTSCGHSYLATMCVLYGTGNNMSTNSQFCHV